MPLLNPLRRKSYLKGVITQFSCCLHWENTLSPLSFRIIENTRTSYYFQEEAAPNISSYFDRSLFNHVIIQSSWNEPSLCQLVASLGALYKAGSPKKTNLPKEETDPHRQYAFQKYGRALKSIQARISADQYRDATRVALIALLLLYCFESLYEDIDSARNHIESALQLMKTQLVRARRRYEHSNNSSPTPNWTTTLP
jgi:hypothetical protein